MPNFAKGEHELETRLDKWLYFIKNLENFQVIPEIFKNEVVFTEAIEKAELSKMSDADLRKYYASLKAYRDDIATLKTAKREGREEGIEEGKQEKAIEMAKKCLKRGMSVPDIADLTGLTEDEIRNITV
jgi:predicted transposase/invertase (TIGR01784 family)